MLPDGLGSTAVPSPVATSIEGFVAERAPAWQRLARLCSGAGTRTGLSAPDVLQFSALYREAAADLAIARLRYPSLVPQLNELVGDAFGRLYGSRRTRLRAAGGFLTAGFPRLVRHMRAQVGVSAVLLFGPALALYCYASLDAEGGKSFLPDALRRAADLPPPGSRSLGVGVRGALSTQIFTNNIRVVFFTFALGVTLGLGTAAVLTFNGIMLGALAGIFAARGIYEPFWALILPHGLLELSCVVIGGACGIRLGWALVDPGPRRRSVALARSAQEAGMAAACLAPALVVAGVIEGFVTPSGLPGPVRIGVGVVVASAFWAWLLLGGRAPSGSAAAANTVTW